MTRLRVLSLVCAAVFLQLVSPLHSRSVLAAAPAPVAISADEPHPDTPIVVHPPSRVHGEARPIVTRDERERAHRRDHRRRQQLQRQREEEDRRQEIDLLNEQRRQTAEGMERMVELPPPHLGGSLSVPSSSSIGITGIDSLGTDSPLAPGDDEANRRTPHRTITINVGERKEMKHEKERVDTDHATTTPSLAGESGVTNDTAAYDTRALIEQIEVREKRE